MIQTDVETNLDSDASDEFIISKIQQGQDELFAELLKRYKARISCYAKRFLRDEEDVKDAVQDTFIKAYKNIEGFDNERKFSSWIYRIAHNECINFLKKRKTEKIPLFDMDILFPHIAREKHIDELNQRQLKEMLDSSMSKLDIKYKEPLALYYLDGFDYKGISDVLHIPIDTVGVRISRGKKLLREYYNKEANK